MEIIDLEAQIQALHQVANDAATTVNTRGDLLVDRLQDIPNRARWITTHSVWQGAATALAVAQTCTGHNLLILESVLLEQQTIGQHDYINMNAYTAKEFKSLWIS